MLRGLEEAHQLTSLPKPLVGGRQRDPVCAQVAWVVLGQTLVSVEVVTRVHLISQSVEVGGLAVIAVGSVAALHIGAMMT